MSAPGLRAFVAERLGCENNNSFRQVLVNGEWFAAQGFHAEPGFGVAGYIHHDFHGDCGKTACTHPSTKPFHQGGTP
jgi:hypothetical protein